MAAVHPISTHLRMISMNAYGENGSFVDIYMEAKISLGAGDTMLMTCTILRTKVLLPYPSGMIKLLFSYLWCEEYFDFFLIYCHAQDS